MNQRTFVMLKPDAVKRKLMGEIIRMIEQAGLTITRMEMRNVTPELAEAHYPDSETWLRTAGEKSIDMYRSNNWDIIRDMGTEDPIEIGKQIKRRLVEFLISGPVVAMIVEGNLAVPNIRRLCGNTMPNLADPSSIRGRWSCDSADQAVKENRPIHNLVHASGTPEEAEEEIALWYPS